MKNVTKKLMLAVKEVGGEVQKTGWNNFSKYAYITESDINKAVLPALLKHGLLLTTSLERVVETPSSADTKNRFATVELVHTIIDSESGEQLTLKSAGTAADTLDKAIYKAYTGACKYFMMKLFLISGDDSDPENDGAVAKPATQNFVGKPDAKPTPTSAPTSTKPSYSSPKAFTPTAPKVAPPTPSVTPVPAPEAAATPPSTPTAPVSSFRQFKVNK